MKYVDDYIGIRHHIICSVVVFEKSQLIAQTTSYQVNFENLLNPAFYHFHYENCYNKSKAY